MLLIFVTVHVHNINAEFTEKFREMQITFRNKYMFTPTANRGP